jgi:septal ring factor EnvC (AmiA/AmiB activator)
MKHLIDPQVCAVYCAQVLNFPWESGGTMAVRMAEGVSAQVPADDFQALEEKIYRTIELYKSAREARSVAERDSQRLRQHLDEREEELNTLRREMVRLRKEREEIRGRVEKMLGQIESISEEQAVS